MMGRFSFLRVGVHRTRSGLDMVFEGRGLGFGVWGLGFRVLW